MSRAHSNHTLKSIEIVEDTAKAKIAYDLTDPETGRYITRAIETIEVPIEKSIKTGLTSMFNHAINNHPTEPGLEVNK